MYKLILVKYGPDKNNWFKKVIYTRTEQMYNKYIQAAQEGDIQVKKRNFDEYRIEKVTNEQPSYYRD